jgi:nitrogen fixation/metabolism regulation signal transduction histidine kinase
MARTFSGQLFRQFLLFSLIPTLVMALAGYYVASQSADRDDPESSLSSAIPASYFNDLLYDRIDQGVRVWLADSSKLPTMLDFLILKGTSGSPPTLIVGQLPAETVDSILMAQQVRLRGILFLDSLVVQYSSLGLADRANVCGGFIHDPGYRYLVESIQSDLATRSRRRETEKNFTLFLAIMFLVLSSVTVVVSYILSRRTARGLAAPLQQLSAASNRIAHGDFEPRVNPSGAGEVRTLIQNFNHMARQLDRTTHRLAQSERVAAWRNVARRFAHELKNPLQPVLISLYRIRKILSNSDLSDQVEEPLTAAAEEIEHLTDLADRFSSLAKLPEPKPARVEMGALLNSIAELYREMLAEADFKLKLPPDPVHCRIDPSYFRDAIHNLLKNAVEAVGGHGLVELSLEVSDAIFVRVRDNGPGMSPEALHQARIPYFTTKASGSGIGLAVVEKIVGELGGQLSIKSSPGAGTTVEIALIAREK